MLARSSNFSNKRISPRIDKFYTSIPEKDNWVMVPKDTKKITFFVEASNTETVLFWLVPTGTQTWNERELIGYHINKDEDGKFKFTWKIDRHLHDHLHIQALSENEISGSIINIATYP
ncbi:hypothetical protein CN601_21615 [Bacillus sp. AFS017336]|nr:hypothetical protein CN601_21615 [Bacillus sp. AFS017336]